MDDYKICTKCKEVKNVNNFYVHKSGVKVGKFYSKCKKCIKEESTSWRKTHREQFNRNTRNSMYRTGRHLGPAKDNPDCPCYLGNIGEYILADSFGSVEMMPPTNIGYDFVCKNGYKIDAKTACLRKDKQFHFEINKNKVCDYFICLGFEDRLSLIPCKVWVIPGCVVNNKIGISMSSNNSKYDKYLYDINKINMSKIVGDGN